MGQMRLELLQIPSISCLAYIFLPVYARRTLAGFASICLLWDKWWQAIVAPKCQPFYMQCHQEQTVTSICGGTVLWLHRMQQNSLFMSQSIITLSSGDRQWVLFGQHSSCRSGTASHFPVAIALQKAMPWVCRSVCLLLNPTSKCFCHSFCRELFSVSIHWEAPGEMVISFPARTFEGPFYNGGHLEGEGKERGILSHLQCWAFLLFIQILPLFNSAVQDGNSNKVSKQMLCREKLFLCGWFSCPVAKFYYE